MRGLGKLLRHRNHGLRRCVARGQRVCGRILPKLPEWQRVSYECAKMRRERLPLGLVVAQAMGIGLDAAVQIAGGREKIGLHLRRRRK